MLVNDGTNEFQTSKSSWIAAPYNPKDIADYAVEAEIQWVRDAGTVIGFGIVVRSEDQGRYWVGYSPYPCPNGRCDRYALIGAGDHFYSAVSGTNLIAKTNFEPGTGWHSYRVEVQGTSIRLLVDGALLLETTDSRYLSGGQVGLWSSGTQINVRSFKVIKL